MSNAGTPVVAATHIPSGAATPRVCGTAWVISSVLTVICLLGWCYLGASTMGILPEGILASLWARWIADVPIGWILVAAYGLTLGGLLLTRSRRVSPWRAGWKLVSVFAVALLAVSVCLLAAGIVTEQTNLRAWLIVNGVGVATSLMLLVYLAGARRAEASTAGQGLSLASADRLIYGLTVAVLLVGPTAAPQWLGEAAEQHPMAEYRRTTAFGRTYFDTGPGPERHYVTEYDAEVRPHQAPVLGSPEAEQFLFFWFDYTDPYCRAVDKQLVEVREHFGDRLAVVPVPFPLNGSCNPDQMFEPTAEANAEACDYARLALGVWKAKPEAFESFHEWLFAPERVPPVEQARARAEELVGANALDRVLADPQLNRLLFSGIKSTPSQFDARRPLPKVGWVGRIMTAEVVPTDTLIRYLNEEFQFEPTAHDHGASGGDHAGHSHGPMDGAPAASTLGY